MAFAGFLMLPADSASTSRVFHAYNRSAADRPSSPQSGESAGSSGSGVISTPASMLRILIRNPRRLQFVQQQTPLRIDDGRDRSA